MRNSGANYSKGLHELSDGLWTYLQPRGTWGYSNAGLVSGDGDSLLVDTLFDLKLTREMLDETGPRPGGHVPRDGALSQAAHRADAVAADGRVGTPDLLQIDEARW
jgi:hypothetical protein